MSEYTTIILSAAVGIISSMLIGLVSKHLDLWHSSRTARLNRQIEIGEKAYIYLHYLRTSLNEVYLKFRVELLNQVRIAIHDSNFNSEEFVKQFSAATSEREIEECLELAQLYFGIRTDVLLDRVNLLGSKVRTKYIEVMRGMDATRVQMSNQTISTSDGMSKMLSSVNDYCQGMEDGIKPIVESIENMMDRLKSDLHLPR